MSKNLQHYRKAYEKGTLTKTEMARDPFQQFQQWFEIAEATNAVDEVNAMALTTIGEDNFPKARMVLLKGYDTNGFVFYTNYHSEKGKAIAHNPNVCISFFWPTLERQVIIKGVAKKISEQRSAAYHESRPRKSQLGALASQQGQTIESREELEDRLAVLQKKYKNRPVPKPAHWGGYNISPIYFEFWQGRRNRLHDRLVYKRGASSVWTITRLQP
ncbi:MAG: pyridoxamine 5'-phosphate oxidase [Marinirhabdus sp.]